MRTIKYITIHCSDTPNGRPNNAKDINAWHKERKFNRLITNYQKFNPELKHIGYQYIINVDGKIETGRAENETGAHVVGYNIGNIGICMIGKDKYTPLQWNALQKLVKEILSRYPMAEVKGHRDYPNVGKTCPGFNVKDWLENYMSPEEKNIYVME
jgi:hypothetical protein